jgi:hypothetical protein
MLAKYYKEYIIENQPSDPAFNISISIATDDAKFGKYEPISKQAT